MRAAVSNHLQEATARVVVLVVLLEVLREVVNAARKDRDLDARRARIGLVALSGLNDARLLLRGKHVPLPYHILIICARVVGWLRLDPSSIALPSGIRSFSTAKANGGNYGANVRASCIVRSKSTNALVTKNNSSVHGEQISCRRV